MQTNVRQQDSARRVGDFQTRSIVELSEKNRASTYLAKSLAQGELALYLGAGISKGVGLPNWEELVVACERGVGIDPPKKGERDQSKLMNAMRLVRRAVRDGGHEQADFRELVRNNLYPEEFLENDEYSDSCLTDLTLIALGALIMSSSRGSIRDVVTLNFDDLLEWYLSLHGFTSQSVTELPSLVRADVDVNIFHAHGYLPLDAKRSQPTDWIVLTHDEFVRRVNGTSGRAWPRFLTNLWATKTILAVGTSLGDIDFESQLDLSQEEKPDGAGPAGFVINRQFDDDEAETLREKGMVPVSVGSYEAIPHFLLEICRKSANLR